MRGIRIGPRRGSGPAWKGKEKKTGRAAGGWMRWGSIMAAVCYDLLNQVLFDKTVLSASVFIASPVAPSTKGSR